MVLVTCRCSLSSLPPNTATGASTAVVPLSAAGVRVRRARQVPAGHLVPAPTCPPCAALDAHRSAVRAHGTLASLPRSGASTRPAACRPCCSWSLPSTRSQASSAAEWKLSDRSYGNSMTLDTMVEVPTAGFDGVRPQLREDCDVSNKHPSGRDPMKSCFCVAAGRRHVRLR